MEKENVIRDDKPRESVLDKAAAAITKSGDSDKRDKKQETAVRNSSNSQ